VHRSLSFSQHSGPCSRAHRRCTRRSPVSSLPHHSHLEQSFGIKTVLSRCYGEDSFHALVQFTFDDLSGSDLFELTWARRRSASFFSRVYHQGPSPKIFCLGARMSYALKNFRKCSNPGGIQLLPLRSTLKKTSLVRHSASSWCSLPGCHRSTCTARRLAANCSEFRVCPSLQFSQHEAIPDLRERS
jgi:hypothetical protein